jgi:hypothetical protein
MKLLSLSLLVGLSACATATPPAVSIQQINAFDDLVKRAEAAGAAEEPQEAAARLHEAKSDFYYAQHIPADPDHARRLVAKAQADAQAALDLAQRHTQQQVVAREQAHQEAAAREQARHEVMMAGAATSQ